ncbi:hypothetical protein ADL29_13000 [Streptomyces chattanoogensis]|uniref:Uncharacterized protein n=1 Tax=Streptomyces chattanoogensis TaxID=66876 RepID=A0A0N0XYD1_9ACTN|nr:hypothetical protein [Streptomyces chattanoogensis]KPC63973.1 hypothetical protein ADL29_13000 [Streptomyces chattanoogensis]
MPRNCRPVHLPDRVPVPESEPVAGCDVCAALVRQREAARAVGDKSTLIDRNIELRRHPHAKAVRA